MLKFIPTRNAGEPLFFPILYLSITFMHQLITPPTRNAREPAISSNEWDNNWKTVVTRAISIH